MPQPSGNRPSDEYYKAPGRRYRAKGEGKHLVVYMYSDDFARLEALIAATGVNRSAILRMALRLLHTKLCTEGETDGADHPGS